MPRRLSPASMRRIMTQRANNYAHHFECRETVKAMATEKRETIMHAAGHLRAPELNLFGATDRSRDEAQALLYLANRVGISDPWLLNPWYVSDAGWQAFQDAWDNLPEPVDFVHTPLCTNPEVVPFVHSQDN